MTPAHRTLLEGGLGYHGLTLTNPDKRVDLPTEVQVFRGIIGVQEHGQIAFYHDLYHVEEWLIDQARKLGYGAYLGQLIGNDE